MPSGYSHSTVGGVATARPPATTTIRVDGSHPPTTVLHWHIMNSSGSISPRRRAMNWAAEVVRTRTTVGIRRQTNPHTTNGTTEASATAAENGPAGSDAMAPTAVSPAATGAGPPRGSRPAA